MANLTTKELNYLKDFLSWELYMAKLCNQYAGQMSDHDFSQMIEDAGRVHQQNFNEFYDYLERS